MRSRNAELNKSRRAAIIAAASASFVQRGFHSTSMKDICAVAAMSPGTIYHYFRSKADIIAGIVDDERQWRNDLLAPLAHTDDFLTSFSAILDEIVVRVSDSDLALQAEVIAEVLRQPDLQERVRANDLETWETVAMAIRSAQASRQLNPDLNPDHAARLVVNMVDGLMSQATLHGLDQINDQLPSMKSALARMLTGQGEGK